MVERDYVLGTHDDEIVRLGLQHRVWRPNVLDCWRRVGITEGSKVIDVGAGPGYATLDLAEIVGPTGSVYAVERSHRFNEFAQKVYADRRLHHIQIDELDLMTDSFSVTHFDFAWCRWVACFVPEPIKIVENMARSLRSGGLAIVHDYINYDGWRMGPDCPRHREFVDEVIASWHDSGGTPNVALQLPAMFEGGGFRVKEMRPISFAITPADYIWRWPATFIETHVQRLLEMGRVDQAFCERLLAEFRLAEQTPGTVMLTPTVLEIVAERL